MKINNPKIIPADADYRRSRPPVICYKTDSLQNQSLNILLSARDTMKKKAEIIVPPREAVCCDIPMGHFFRICSIEGPQVGDLNLWSARDLSEKFYSGKTRALHGTHLSTGDQMWSSFPFLRPLATISHDTLDWYGWDADGGSVHDVIGTRCDPYTEKLLTNTDYHHCCHSNLIRALADFRNLTYAKSEKFIHDVLNVFMCTGFTLDTHQYFMKASPVRPGDYIEFYAETNLVAGLSACPGGDCSTEHSSNRTNCHPLLIEIFSSDDPKLHDYPLSSSSTYSGKHKTSS